MLRDSEKIKKLDGYTKDEIIAALARDFRGGDIDRLISCLESTQSSTANARIMPRGRGGMGKGCNRNHKKG